MTTKLYSKKYLFEALAAAKLPSTRPSVIKYERLGLIPVPTGNAVLGGHGQRFYTKEQIKLAVDNVRKHIGA